MAQSPNELHIPFFEKLKSIPEIFGIRINEEPHYTVLKKDKAIEVRRYAPQLIAKVTIANPNFDQFRQAAFTILAKYIFGGNVAGADMAMTSPVLQQQGAEKAPRKKSVDMEMTSPVLQEKSGKNAWTMSFVLPSKYSLATVPKPLDPQVKLQELPSYDFACIRYSGNNDLELVKENEQKLEQWLSNHAAYKKTGDYFAAQYDQPFAVPFLKRNEVHVKVLTNVH